MPHLHCGHQIETPASKLPPRCATRTTGDPWSFARHEMVLPFKLRQIANEQSFGSAAAAALREGAKHWWISPNRFSSDSKVRRGNGSKALGTGHVAQATRSIPSSCTAAALERPSMKRSRPSTRSSGVARLAMPGCPIGPLTRLCAPESQRSEEPRADRMGSAPLQSVVSRVRTRSATDVRGGGNCRDPLQPASNPAITSPIIGASASGQLADSLVAAEKGPLPQDLKASSTALRRRGGRLTPCADRYFIAAPVPAISTRRDNDSRYQSHRRRERY